MVWRKALIWSERVVSRMRFSRANVACFRNNAGWESGTLSRARVPADNRARVSSRSLHRRFKLVAECHEFIDLGDDAALFGEGWNSVQV